MISERGKEDWECEYERFPRLFQAADSIPGLTWPTMTFRDRMTLYLGRRRGRSEHLGRAHTAGDAIALVPDAGVMLDRRHRRVQVGLLLRRRAFQRLAGHARRDPALRAGARSRRGAATRWPAATSSTRRSR